MILKFLTFRAVAPVGALFGLLLYAAPAIAQGCEPIRFTTPIDLGAAGQAYQPSQKWQLTLAYRHLGSNQFFVGTHVIPRNEFTPVFNIHTLVVAAAYSITDRYRVQVNLPIQTGTHTGVYPDGLSHTQRASGIGDLSVTGDAWLLSPDGALKPVGCARSTTIG